MAQVSGDIDHGKYQEEAKRRWGDTDAYAESARRTSHYSTEDWQRYEAANEEVCKTIAAPMDQGAPPTDPGALDAVEQARLQIDTWFYPCSRAMHAELGKMYVADPRFTATYDTIRPGMAQYICDATQANLARTTPR